MNKTQKQMLAAINCTDTTWGTAINNDDDDDKDYLHADTNNDPDFQEEEK